MIRSFNEWLKTKNEVNYPYDQDNDSPKMHRFVEPEEVGPPDNFSTDSGGNYPFKIGNDQAGRFIKNNPEVINANNQQIQKTQELALKGLDILGLNRQKINGDQQEKSNLLRWRPTIQQIVQYIRQWIRSNDQKAFNDHIARKEAGEGTKDIDFVNQWIGNNNKWLGWNQQTCINMLAAFAAKAEELNSRRASQYFYPNRSIA